jgi:hypothetical protein
MSLLDHREVEVMQNTPCVVLLLTRAHFGGLTFRNCRTYMAEITPEDWQSPHPADPPTVAPSFNLLQTQRSAQDMASTAPNGDPPAVATRLVATANQSLSLVRQKPYCSIQR